MRPATLFPAALLASLALATAIPVALAQADLSESQMIEGLRMRGIRPPIARPDVPAESPAPGGADARPVQPSVVPPVTERESAPAISMNIQFRTNSAELTPAAVQTLDRLGHVLSDQSFPSYRFRIEGHTDTVGGSDFNRSLSERRAQAVVDYLVAKHGVSRARLEAVGMGKEGLLVSTGDQVPEPLNRRVQVVNLGS